MSCDLYEGCVAVVFVYCLYCVNISNICPPSILHSVTCSVIMTASNVLYIHDM